MALVLLAGLAALLALLLAGLLTGFGLVLPLLLLTGLTRRLARRLSRLAALVIRHSQSPPGLFSSPEVEPLPRRGRSVKCMEFQRFLVMRQETKHARFHRLG